MTALAEQVQRVLAVALSGSVNKIVGLTVSVTGFPAPLGSICSIARESGPPVRGEVIGFREDETLILPYGDLAGIRRGNRVALVQSAPGIRVGDRLLGRVIDGRGRVVDNRPAPALPHRVSLHATPTSPLRRPRIDAALGTGIRAIDAMLSCGKGQRLGIFAGSGVGKSVLMGQMARSSTADVNVVVLVGERGREVREFLEKDLGPKGLARSVVVAATSDEPALVRLRAAFVGTAIAEYFRDTGRDVLLMMDSVTRFALAQREIGLAAGEPPATRGYPPSVFALLPRLLERSGKTERGSITGFYTVLVEADDANEPISDTVRGILDGHIMLSRKLAQQAHWPAIDVLSSISRSMPDVVSDEHRRSADSLKQLLAAYQENQDLISIGAYQSGSNPLVDAAIRMRDETQKFLRQGMEEQAPFPAAVAGLAKLAQMRTALTRQTVRP
jgi:FliI/YscN family ATPase